MFIEYKCIGLFQINVIKYHFISNNEIIFLSETWRSKKHQKKKKRRIKQRYIVVTENIRIAVAAALTQILW